MPLTGQYRTQLNTIIGKMKDAGEDENAIQQMVGQFKTKYDVPEPPEAPAQPETGKPKLGAFLEGGTGELSGLPQLDRPVEEQPAGEQVMRGLTGGFVQSATFGGARLIPGAHEELERVKKAAPKSFTAGEIGGFLAGPQALVQKGAAKLIGKTAIPKIIQRIIAPAAAAGVSEFGIGATEEGGLDVGAGVKRGATGAAMALGTGGVLEIASPVLRKVALGLTKSQFKPLKKMTARGFKEEMVEKNGWGGQFKDVVKKTTKALDKTDPETDALLAAFAKKNPDANIDIVKVAGRLRQDAKDGALEGLAGMEDEVVKLAEKFFDSVTRPKAGIIDEATRKVPITKVRELKRYINEFGQNAFISQPEIKSSESAGKKFAKMLYFRVMEESQDMVPGLAAKNKLMREAMLVREVAEAAQERFGKTNIFTGMTQMLMMLGGIGGVGAKAGLGAGAVVGGGAAAGSRFLSSGRGAGWTSRLGKIAGAEPTKRAAAAVAQRAGRELVPEEEEEPRPVSYKSLSGLRGL